MDSLFKNTLELDSVKTHSSSFLCPRFKGQFFFNLEKKTWFPCNCNAYECPQCGVFKEIKLRKALETYLTTWHFCRMWTFTYKASIFTSKEDCYRKTSKIWRYFIIYLRRSAKLNKSLQKVKYIKFMEVHKSGIIHYHVVFNRWLDANTIRQLWRSAIKAVTGCSGFNGNINISDNRDRKNTASYIAKYVTKASQHKLKRLRKWSKSERIAIFAKVIPNQSVICTNSRILTLILKSIKHNITHIEFYADSRQNNFITMDENGEILCHLVLPLKKE